MLGAIRQHLIKKNNYSPSLKGFVFVRRSDLGRPLNRGHFSRWLKWLGKTDNTSYLPKSQAILRWNWKGEL